MRYYAALYEVNIFDPRWPDRYCLMSRSRWLAIHVPGHDQITKVALALVSPYVVEFKTRYERAQWLAEAQIPVKGIWNVEVKQEWIDEVKVP